MFQKVETARIYIYVCVCVNRRGHVGISKRFWLAIIKLHRIQIYLKLSRIFLGFLPARQLAHGPNFQGAISRPRSSGPRYVWNVWNVINRSIIIILYMYFTTYLCLFYIILHVLLNSNNNFGTFNCILNSTYNNGINLTNGTKIQSLQ